MPAYTPPQPRRASEAHAPDSTAIARAAATWAAEQDRGIGGAGHPGALCSYDETEKEEEMGLMRLADAMREVGDTRGAPVHRVHWVAFDQVRAARREGDRTNLPKVKEAGLLPR
jgi:hypothetical protein